MTASIDIAAPWLCGRAAFHVALSARLRHYDACAPIDVFRNNTDGRRSHVGAPGYGKHYACL